MKDSFLMATNKNNNLNQKIISLQDASVYSGYSQKYLNLRARQGKLKAFKAGRNWMTSKEWVDEFLGRTPITETKFISLPEASSYSGFSQQYLNLRARQGKLHAFKTGRNWVTTKAWIDEFREKKDTAL